MALSRGARKGFKKNRNSHYEIIRKIGSLKVQANHLVNHHTFIYVFMLHKIDFT